MSEHLTSENSFSFFLYRLKVFFFSLQWKDFCESFFGEASFQSTPRWKVTTCSSHHLLLTLQAYRWGRRSNPRPSQVKGLWRDGLIISIWIAFDTSTVSYLKKYQKGIKCIYCICRVPSESFASPDPETCLIAVPKPETLKLEESSPATTSTPSPDSPSHSSGQPNSPAESSGCSLSPHLKVCCLYELYHSKVWGQ